MIGALSPLAPPPSPSLRFGQQLTQCCFSSLAQGRFDALPSRFATSIMHRVLQCVSSLHVGIAQAGLNALAFMRQSGVVFDPTNLGRVHRVLEVRVLCVTSVLGASQCIAVCQPLCAIETQCELCGAVRLACFGGVGIVVPCTAAGCVC